MTSSLNTAHWRFGLLVRILAWWYAATVLTWMGAPPLPEEPKFAPPKTWDQRHPNGYEEWGREKREAVPLTWMNQDVAGQPSPGNDLTLDDKLNALDKAKGF